MKENIRPSIVMLVLFTLILGLAYPAALTGIARVVFPSKSTGSTIERDGKVVGSELVGQPFDDPKYFWGRPSATTPANNGASSGGSNLGPTAQAQADAVSGRVAALRDALRAADPSLKETDPSLTASVPADLVTASGSGLDPDISPEAALYQVHRVAMVRGMKGREQELKALVERSVKGRTLGFMGEPRVNVLLLNLELDAMTK